MALDTAGEREMRIFFNITMERLPCQFASVDLYDVMGTSLTNVSTSLLKFKVAPDAGHRQEYFVDDDHRVAHEEIDAEVKDMLMAMPDTLPTLTDHDFDRFVKMNGL